MTSSSNSSAAARPARAALLNTLIVAGGYLLSRVLGLIRDIIILHQFGTGYEIDAFRASFGVLDLIYLVVAGGALGSAFIPVFSEFLTKQQLDQAWRLANTLLNWVLIGLVVACSLIALFAEPLVALTVGSGFDEEKRALTVFILRLLLIQPALLGLGGLAKATLESFDRFTLPAVGSNLYNFGIIGGALVAHWFGIYGLVGGVIVGALLFVLIQVPGLLKVGWRYAPSLAIGTPGLGQVGRLLGPRLFGQSAWQIGLVATASFASQLGDGAVTANASALQLMMLPHGLIALSLGTVIFPQLARLYAAGDTAGLQTTVLGAVRQVLFVALPASAILGVLSLPIVRVLFERGQFNADSSMMTSEALTSYAVGLAAFAAAEILVRCFYAMQDTRTPVKIGIVTVALNIGLGWTALRVGAGLRGLALGFSIANTLEMLLLLAYLRPRLGGLNVSFWRSVGVMLLDTVLVAVVLFGLQEVSVEWLPSLQAGDTTYSWTSDFVPLVAWLAVASGVAMMAYMALASVLRLEELQSTLARVKGIVGRFRRR